MLSCSEKGTHVEKVLMLTTSSCRCCRSWLIAAGMVLAVPFAISTSFMRTGSSAIRVYIAAEHGEVLLGNNISNFVGHDAVHG